jgi:hypothetical protein
MQNFTHALTVFCSLPSIGTASHRVQSNLPNGCQSIVPFILSNYALLNYSRISRLNMLADFALLALLQPRRHQPSM